MISAPDLPRRVEEYDSRQYLIPGLVSISFRHLTPREVVTLASCSGLEAIEWGGDIHVPVSAVAHAKEVGRMTSDLGLAVAAYGSYFRVVEADGVEPEFAPVLDTALALGAPRIRVWSGVRASCEATDHDFERLAARLNILATQAEESGVKVSLESHSGTLTDTYSSSLRLLTLASHPNIDLVWQPTPGLPVADCRDGLAACLPYVSNLHAFHWLANGERRPLAEGYEIWADYFAVALPVAAPRFVLLEFFRDDDPAHLPAEASTLRSLLASLSHHT